MFLDQQRRHLAVAGVGHPRQQRFLLEPEMAGDVVFESAHQLPGQTREFRREARRTGERHLDLAEQGEVAAVLVVQDAADLG